MEVIVYDGAGEKFGGIGHVEPHMLKRVLQEMALSAAEFATNPDIGAPFGFLPAEGHIPQTTATAATPEEFEAVCAAEGIGPGDGEG